MENGLPPKNIMDALREQELEAENANLRDEVARLQDAVHDYAEELTEAEGATKMAEVEVERQKNIVAAQEMQVAALRKAARTTEESLAATEAKLEVLLGRKFPVQGGAPVPWEMVEPHEKQMVKNHSQDIERLAQRGGLDCLELLATLDDRDLRHIFMIEQKDMEQRRREAHDELERRRVVFERDVIAALTAPAANGGDDE